MTMCGYGTGCACGCCGEWPERLTFLRERAVFFGVWGKNPLGECACGRGTVVSDDGRDHRFGAVGPCTSPAKHPVVWRDASGLQGFVHGHRDAVAWPEWAGGLGSDVAALGGRMAVAVPGDVWVLDCDNAKAWRALVRLFKTGAVSFDEVLAVAQTARGWHVWLRAERGGWTGGTAQRALDASLRGTGDGAAARACGGLEVKSGGGYVVWPDGAEREWVDVMVFARQVAWHGSVAYGPGSGAAPAVAAVKLVSGDPPPVSGVPEESVIAQFEEWTAAEQAQWAAGSWSTLEINAVGVAKAPAGGRNNKLNATTWYVGRLAVLGGQRYAEVFSLLVNAGVAAGLEDRECRATVRSGLRGLEES